MAVKLCLYKVFAGRERLGLRTDMVSLELDSGGVWRSPQGFHELVGKVTVPEHQVLFQGEKMVHELELVQEYVEQALARYLKRGVN